MELTQFKKEFKLLNFVKFDNLILFKDLELYDADTEQSVFFKTFDEMLNYKHQDKTMAQLIEERESLDLELAGGRGQSSGKQKSLFGDQDGGGGEDESESDLPARMNRMYNGNKMSVDNTVSNFRNEHVNASKEHGLIYDDDGFVSTYKHGNDNSVSWKVSELSKGNLIHNHPNNSNFSKADLDTWSSTGLKSITASGKTQDYTVTKGSKFDSKGFAKALANAKTRQTDYNKAVDTFLKQNTKKYGYKYSVKKYN